MSPSTLNFNEALARAQANQTRQVQEGTPSGNSSQLDAWFAAISNQPPPPGSQPMQRAADQWVEAVAATTAVAVDEEALRARELLEVQAEAAKEAAEWAAYRAANPPVDPVRAAQQAKARSERDDEEREAAYRVDAARADAQMAQMWAARERAAGVASPWASVG